MEKTKSTNFRFSFTKYKIITAILLVLSIFLIFVIIYNFITFIELLPKEESYTYKKIETNVINTLKVVFNRNEILEDILEHNMKAIYILLLKEYENNDGIPEKMDLNGICHKINKNIDLYIIDNKGNVIKATNEKYKFIDCEKWEEYYLYNQEDPFMNKFDNVWFDIGSDNILPEKFSFLPTPDHKYFFKLELKNIFNKDYSLSQILEKFILNNSYLLNIRVFNKNTCLSNKDNFIPDEDFLRRINEMKDAYEITDSINEKTIKYIKIKTTKSNLFVELTFNNKIYNNKIKNYHFKLILFVLALFVLPIILIFFSKYNINKQEKSKYKIQNYNTKLQQVVAKLANPFYKKNKQYLKELRMALAVQQSIIPDTHKFNRKEIKFYAKYMPIDAIGGDLYDVIRIGKNGYSVFIADVSGHGVSAALITAMAKVLFANNSHWGVSPAEVCKNVNNEIFKLIGGTGYFLTAIYGIINLENGTFQYACGGHLPGILYRTQTKQIIKLYAKGPIIGAFENDEIDFGTNSLKLIEGDKIILYTDGIIEQRNKKGLFYKEKKLIEFIERNHNLKPENLINGIIEDVEKYSNGFPVQDDRAVLCIEFVSKAI